MVSSKYKGGFLLDWKRIKAEYIAGGTSYRKLAEKYGVSFSTLRKVAAKEQWTELRNKTRTKTDTKISDSVSDKEADKAVNIIDVADKLLCKISELMDAVPLDTQSMKHLTSALKDLKEIKGFKSDADMREQEARIRNLEKQAEAEKTDTEIKVVIEGDLDAYSK
jgi:transposase